MKNPHFDAVALGVPSRENLVNRFRRQADDGSDNLLVRPPMMCVGPRPVS